VTEHSGLLLIVSAHKTIMHRNVLLEKAPARIFQQVPRERSILALRISVDQAAPRRNSTLASFLGDISVCEYAQCATRFDAASSRSCLSLRALCRSGR